MENIFLFIFVSILSVGFILSIIKEYSNKNPSISYFLFLIGNFQFVLIPFYYFIFFGNDFYFYYEPKASEVLLLVFYFSLVFIASLFLRNKRNKFLFIQEGINYKNKDKDKDKVINLIVLLIIMNLINLLLPFGLISQFYYYSLCGIATYCYYFSLIVNIKKKFLKYLLILLCLIPFISSTVRFSSIVVATIVFLLKKKSQNRPNIVLLFISLCLVAVISIFSKDMLKSGYTFEQSSVTVPFRISRGDIFNIESLPVALHFEESIRSHLSPNIRPLGKTIATGFLFPRFFDSSFVGMGKYYILNVLAKDKTLEPTWSLSYPLLYESLSNFGFIFGFLFLFFILFLVKKLFSIKNNLPVSPNLLFYSIFLFWAGRGDFVFAFFPAFWGYISVLLVCNLVLLIKVK